MDTYQFECKHCGRTCSTEAAQPSRWFHLTLGVVTLGLWLVPYALFRLFHLFWISKCEHCDKRRLRFLAIFLSMFIGTFEVGWVIYYFMEIAPAQIVRDFSNAQIPDNLDLNSNVDSDNIWPVIKYITAVAIMPSLGSTIANDWPYIVLVWGSIVVVVGFSVPSRYLEKD